MPMTDPLTGTVTKNSARAGAYIGAPASVVVIWYLNTHVFKEQMPVEVGGMFGIVVAKIIEVFWYIGEQLWKKVGIEIQ